MVSLKLSGRKWVWDCRTYTLYLSPDVVIRENIEVHTPGQEIVIHGTNDLKSTQTTILSSRAITLDYADLVSFMGEHAQTAGWILFVIITIFVVTAVSNGANLNDGMWMEWPQVIPP